MTFPAILFSIIMASLYGSIFHIIKGGNLFTLFIYVLVSNIGFFGGQYLAGLIGISLFPLGTINFGVGTISSIGILLIGGWVSRPLE